MLLIYHFMHYIICTVLGLFLFSFCTDVMNNVFFWCGAGEEPKTISVVLYLDLQD